MKKIIASASLIIAVLAGSTGTASAGTLDFGICEWAPHMCQSVMKSDTEFRVAPRSLERVTQTGWSGHEIRVSLVTMR